LCEEVHEFWNKGGAFDALTGTAVECQVVVYHQ
jgi:hypothetical protein